MKTLIKSLAGRLGLRPPEVSPAGYFPHYRSLAVPFAQSQDARPNTLVFVLPIVSRGSGGISDIVHVGQALQRAEAIKVYYLLSHQQSLEAGRELLRWVAPDVDSAQVLDRLDFAPEYLCYTTWRTVYEAAALPSRKKLYFVQDDESLFESAGVAQFYARHVFQLGLPLITLGPWLVGHLRALGCSAPMASMPFPFSDELDLAPEQTRDTVAFYIQPDKVHRGSELLIEAARLLSPCLQREHPGVGISFFGSRINTHIAFEFPCEVHGVMDHAVLTRLLRRSRVGVSASFTNISLMPFRYVAAGAYGVDLDLPNVRLNIPELALPAFRLAVPSAQALSAAVLEVLRSGTGTGAVQSAAHALYQSNGWQACASVFREWLIMLNKVEVA